MWSDAPRLARQQKVVGTGSERGCGVQQHPTARCLEPPLGCLEAAGGCFVQRLRSSAQGMRKPEYRADTLLFPNFSGGVDIRRVCRWAAAEMFELPVSAGCAQLCFTAKHAQMTDCFVPEALLVHVVISFTQFWKGRGEVFAGSAKLLSH